MKPLEEKIVSALEGSSEVDELTQARLNRMRSLAMERVGRSSRSRLWQLSGAGFALSAVLATVLWWQGKPVPMAGEDGWSDMAMVMNEETWDMGQNLDFYIWLEQSQGSTDNVRFPDVQERS